MNILRSPLTRYPRGWFLVGYSDELPSEGVSPVRFFGTDLVLFRAQDGAARLLDAYCPHLGAHLGHGGCVVGNQVRCPYHGWEFDGASGSCTNVPFAKKIPPAARTRAWAVHEEAGMIFAWHHEEGAPPAWDPPRYAPLDVEQQLPWTESRWRVRACIQDINENDVDAAHSPVLHDFTDEPPRIEVSERGPILDVELKIEMNLEYFGLAGATAPTHVHSTKYGLGGADVQQETRLGDTRVWFRSIATTTPIDAEYVDFRMRHTMRRTGRDEVDPGMLASFVKLFEDTVAQDVRMWENKIYLVQPLIAEGDGPIPRYRRWTRQFYSDHEVRRIAALRRGGEDTSVAAELDAR